MAARTPPNLLMQIYIGGELAGQLLADSEDPASRTINFAVLSVINALGPITPTDLASFLGTAPTTVSAQVARLADAGLAERTPNLEDGRSHLLQVTAPGREAVERFVTRLAAALEALEEQLGVEGPAARETLWKVLGAMRAVVAQRTAKR